MDVRWCHRGRKDQVVRDRNVALVAVEELRLALPTVTHLWIRDRDDAVLGDLLFDPASSTAGRIRLDVLLNDPPQKIQGFLERRHLGLLARSARHPALERIDLP